MEEIRCLVCQGQSIADSDAELAGDMRDLVRARIAAGEKPRGGPRWLIERYGGWVSYRPPLEPRSWPLWAAPLACWRSPHGWCADAWSEAQMSGLLILAMIAVSCSPCYGRCGCAGRCSRLQRRRSPFGAAGYALQGRPLSTAARNSGDARRAGAADQGAQGDDGRIHRRQ